MPFSRGIFAQQPSYAFGVNAGLSSFQSLSNSLTGIELSVYYEFPAWFSKAFNFQASLFYLRETEFFLPQSGNGQYYPYFYGATFSGIMRQKLSGSFFLEEQAGLLYMKNYFFSNYNQSNYGVNLGIAGGLDLRGNSFSGFLLSIGYKGGLTFNGDTPSFNSFFVQAHYIL